MNPFGRAAPFLAITLFAVSSVFAAGAAASDK